MHKSSKLFDTKQSYSDLRRGIFKSSERGFSKKSASSLTAGSVGLGLFLNLSRVRALTSTTLFLLRSIVKYTRNMKQNETTAIKPTKMDYQWVLTNYLALRL